MKVLFFSFLFSVVTFFGNSQTPTGITYQAIIRNNNGNPLSNTQVHLRFSILDNGISGNTLYQEIFSSTTNKFGLVNLVIGDGNPTIGNYDNIPWQTSNYLKVELDADNSGNYTILGINKLQSVPYSLYSNDALHATYADTASYVKSISGDKIIKLAFGPTNGISTNSDSGYVVSDLSKSLLDFNISDYHNVTSVNFCAIVKSNNSSNNFEVELYDLTTNQVISNSLISGNNTNYQLLKSANIFDVLPNSESNLSLRIKSSDGQDYVNLQKAYLLINKGQKQVSAVDISETK